LSSLKTKNKKVQKDILAFLSKAQDHDVHLAYYYKAIYQCYKGDFKNARKNLETSYNLGWSFGPFTYDKHALLYPFSQKEELKSFFLKILNSLKNKQRICQ